MITGITVVQHTTSISTRQPEVALEMTHFRDTLRRPATHLRVAQTSLIDPL